MHSSSIRTLLLAAAVLTAVPALQAAAVVSKGHGEADQGFKLDPVPPPAINDAATKATFTIIEGTKDGASADPSVLVDGKVPTTEDQPRANFFFSNGSEGGRLGMDLGSVVSVKSVATYSWHNGNRGPQVYKLWGASGSARNFNALPKRGTDPKTCGWEPIAAVDTRQGGKNGGQHAAEISNKGGRSLGGYRYLLFDVERPSKDDGLGNTFFSEIDVIDARGSAVERLTAPEKIIKTYKSKDKKYTYVVNSTKAPELTDWCEKELIPVVEKWYPKLVELLPSKGYRAPDQVSFEFKTDMGGTPAYAVGNKISLNAQWYPDQLKGEAKGCAIHEMGHVVQNYWRAGETNRNPKETPGWVTEGICDYIRWFLYEPESKGAGLGEDQADRVKYDNSYRISGNFLDWVVTEKDEALLQKLNAVAREGDYEEKLWKEWTGKDLEELNTEWKEAIRKGKRVQK
ncbi:basic secretory protein-like protein [Luteolibacter luteus]|uniref:Secretory protein n=1 Tax=Luteolibacter luteus TaxID=2728835 RepID=A0A858RRM5_9BACT|nr:basic secretory protein-like protein [Luteolibacter luteus]QJE98593.1 hypothetical protein HHL09_23355 [Luteolibacter luteus]